jgi:hypothetical protein
LRRGRVLGVPAVRAAFGGSLSLPSLPLRVIRQLADVLADTLDLAKHTFDRQQAEQIFDRRKR